MTAIASIRLDLGTAMNQHIGVVREEEGMKEGLEKVRQLKQRYESVPVQDKGRTFNTDLIFALETRLHAGLRRDHRHGKPLSAKRAAALSTAATTPNETTRIG